MDVVLRDTVILATLILFLNGCDCINVLSYDYDAILKWPGIMQWNHGDILDLEKTHQTVIFLALMVNGPGRQELLPHQASRLSHHEAIEKP